MRSLPEIRQMNTDWEEKEIYKAVEFLRRVNRVKRVEDAQRLCREEMRNRVADIKAANTSPGYRLDKADIDAILSSHANL